MKMSRGGFCYSGCQQRKGCERHGSSRRCEREVQCSLAANQTRPPEQRLTFPINAGSRLALSPHLGSLRRLAPNQTVFHTLLTQAGCSVSHPPH